MSIEIDCPSCHRHFSAEPAQAGATVQCPACSTAIVVPGQVSTASPPPPPGVMFCPKCGEQNGTNNFKCTRCGFVLQGAPRFVAAEDSTLGGLIPYKNTQALWAYYLGIFSIIPCLGIALGITALVLGIRALNFAKAHPEAKGGAHAWVGIIAGGFFALVYCLMGIGALIAALHK